MNKKLLALGIGLALLTIAAAQLITITEYKTPSGAICFGAPQPFDCEFPPIAQVITPTPGASATVTLSPTRPPIITPTRTATPAPPIALINGDFEQAWTTGWTRFDLWPELPRYNDERGDPRSRHGGAQSLRIFNEFRCWLAGVYQTVNVPQFSTIKFSAWGRTWGAQGFDFDLPPDLSITDGVAVGIDPSGGVSPTSSGIIWEEIDNTEVWRQVSVQAVALAPRVTVFIRVRLGVAGPNNCQWPLPVLMGFVDDASIEIVP
jgi:hypothetical protein